MSKHKTARDRSKDVERLREKRALLRAAGIPISDKEREQARERKRRWRERRREQGLPTRGPAELARDLARRNSRGVLDPEDFSHHDADVRVGP